MSKYIPIPRSWKDWLAPGAPGSDTDPIRAITHDARVDGPAEPPPPGEPVPVDTSVADREDARQAAEKRRRAQGGRTGANPTGGIGDASTPNLAAKSLLGT